MELKAWVAVLFGILLVGIGIAILMTNMTATHAPQTHVEDRQTLEPGRTVTQPVEENISGTEIGATRKKLSTKVFVQHP